MQVKVTFHIREKREELNISLRELEKISRVSKSHISEIERGLRMPSVETICRLAKSMETPVIELFSYK